MKTQSENGKKSRNISVRLSVDTIAAMEKMQSAGVNLSDVIRAAIDLMLSIPDGATVRKETRLVVDRQQSSTKRSKAKG